MSQNGNSNSFKTFVDIKVASHSVFPGNLKAFI